MGLLRPSILALAASLVLSPAPLGAQAVVDSLPIAFGPCHTLVVDGQTIYVGGSFEGMGLASGGTGAVDATGGAVVPGFPKVAGDVYAIVPDGNGGWFLGGAFMALGGVARSNLAHVASDFTVSSWAPEPNGSVFGLTLAAELQVRP